MNLCEVCACVVGIIALPYRLWHSLAVTRLDRCCVCGCVSWPPLCSGGVGGGEVLPRCRLRCVCFSATAHPRAWPVEVLHHTGGRVGGPAGGAWKNGAAPARRPLRRPRHRRVLRSVDSLSWGVCGPGQPGGRVGCGQCGAGATDCTLPHADRRAGPPRGGPCVRACVCVSTSLACMCLLACMFACSSACSDRAFVHAIASCVCGFARAPSIHTRLGSAARWPPA